MLEALYQVIDEHGTVYRIRPNPDTDIGFAGGAYIGWSDEYGKNAADNNEIFISPDVLRDVAKAFALAADEVIMVD
jgi:hypothetical protein